MITVELHKEEINLLKQALSICIVELARVNQEYGFDLDSLRGKIQLLKKKLEKLK